MSFVASAIIVFMLVSFATVTVELIVSAGKPREEPVYTPIGALGAMVITAAWALVAIERWIA